MWRRKRERQRRRSFQRPFLKLFLAVVVLVTVASTIFSLSSSAFTPASSFLWWRKTIHPYSYSLTLPELQQNQHQQPKETNREEENFHLIKYVDCFIGTGGQGHTYPGATVPFGMVQLSPDNGEEGWEYSSGYHYNASTIIGFSHTHLSGTGIGDMLDISLQPLTAPLNTTVLAEFWDLDLRQNFSHSNEVAQPGYYKVILDHGVQVELTATERTGMHRYTFYPPPKGSEFVPGIVLNLCFAINTDILESSMIELTSSSVVSTANSDVGAGILLPNKTLHRTLITGYRKSDGWAVDHEVYFAMEFSVPFSSVTLTEDGEVKKIKKDAGQKTVADGKYSNAYFTFEPKNTFNSSNTTSDAEEGEEEIEQPLVVLVKVGLSSVSAQGAKENLRLENPNWDFDAVRNAAAAAWESELSKILVESGDEEAKTVFYTSLYHSKLAPTLHSDRNGAFKGPDFKVHRVPPGSQSSVTIVDQEESFVDYAEVVEMTNNSAEQAKTNENATSILQASIFSYYSTFSIWDTFRAQHPLLTLLNPDRVKDMMQTFLAHASHQKKGVLPFWPLVGAETRTMPGYHATAMLAEAAAKNLLTTQDIKRVFDAMRATSMDVERGGRFIDEYGFVPADKKDESVTVTLELSYDDWCIAQIAEYLNNSTGAAYFYNRSRGYQRVFDPETQFMRAKFSNNTWKTPFNPHQSEHKEGDYTEGTAWQHLWFVPHDIPGLIQLFNGSANFEAKLDALFEADSSVQGRLTSGDISGLIGQYAHGNEPSHHVAYLYNYVGAQHKTQARVRQILKEMYKAAPDGIIGNEDCGQMSAWYIFSALGFYPVNPAEGRYQLGASLFDRAVIDVGQGKKFEVKARGAESGKVFVKKVYLNEQVLKRWYITHEEIMNGGVLELEMSSEPS